MNPVSVEDDFLTDDAGSDGVENISEHFQQNICEHFHSRLQVINHDGSSSSSQCLIGIGTGH